MDLLDTVVGLAFVVVALALTRSSPSMRLWWAGVGLSWWLGDVAPFGAVHQGVLLVALATYPDGRIRGGRHLLVLGVAVLVAGGVLGQAGAAVGFLSTAALRGRGGYARVSATAIGLWLAGSFTWSRAAPGSFVPSVELTGYEAVLLLVAVTLPLGLWAEARATRTLTDRVLAEEPAGIAGLEAALRQTLGADELRLERDGPSVRMRGHVPAEPVTAAAIDQAIALTLAHERALGEADRQLHELREARSRLLAAADVERSRAGLRLQHQVLALHASTGSLADHPDLAREIEGAAADIERIVAGLPPPGLGDGGIRAALGRLAARHPGDVRLEVDDRARAGVASETALFYACSEALANVAKHARADDVHIVLEAGDPLVLTVTDDGVGSDLARGTGLQHLSDRLLAVGGTLVVESATGRGTRLVAEVPAGQEVRPHSMRT